jgi:hypothetical protein
MTGLATWMFNPWDHGDAALLFAAVVAVAAGLSSRYRKRMGGELAGLAVAAVVTTVYMIGAVASAGFGPLAPLGAVMLFVPAGVIASTTMWIAGRLPHSQDP